MNFLTQKQELAAQVGLDQSDSADNTLLGRWLNTSQRIIAGAADWPFLRATNPLIIQTVADISTGTVTVAAGATSATLSSAPAASVAGSYIQFASSDDWYEITAHTAATTGLTISPAAISANTTATYTIRKFYYSLSSAVDRILSIRQATTPFQLNEMSRDSFLKFKPDPDTTGTPKLFSYAGLDSSSVPQVTLWPTPDAVINLQVDYIQVMTDLSADSDVSIIPQKWHTSTMIEGGKWQAFDYLDDDRDTSSKTLFYAMIEDMKRNIMPSKTLHRRFMPVEAVDLQEEFPLPENFPRV